MFNDAYVKAHKFAMHYIFCCIKSKKLKKGDFSNIMNPLEESSEWGGAP